MAKAATWKQKELLKNLGYTGSMKGLKRDRASELIEAQYSQPAPIPLCPYCHKPFDKPVTRKRKCPNCKETVLVIRGRVYTESAAEKKRQKDAERERKEEAKECLRWKKDDIREQLQCQREFERDMRKYGGLDRNDEAAGFLIRIASTCPASAHVDGLLVRIEDAQERPELLPPYDTCTDDCECVFDLVQRSEVPQGTHYAEWVDADVAASSTGESEALPIRKAAHAIRTKRPSKRTPTKKEQDELSSSIGCLVIIVIVIIIYVIGC